MYLVLNENDHPLVLDGYSGMPKSGILLQGDFATLFPNYKSAWRAWQRTKKYTQNNDFHWNTDLWRTMRVIAK